MKPDTSEAHFAMATRHIEEAHSHLNWAVGSLTQASTANRQPKVRQGLREHADRVKAERDRVRTLVLDDFPQPAEPKPPRNFYQEALDVQDACKGSGVAHFLVECFEFLQTLPECTGTEWRNKHPLIRAVISKLESLAGGDGWTVGTNGNPSYFNELRKLSDDWKAAHAPNAERHDEAQRCIVCGTLVTPGQRTLKSANHAVHEDCASL